MQRYCDGDDAALRTLHAIAAPLLTRYLMRLLGERSGVDEIVQHTFIKLHRYRATYKPGADPLPWLYTIAHRTCLDELRRRGRLRHSRPWNDALHGPTAMLDGAPQDSGPLYEDAVIEAMLAGLERLPRGQRTALLLTKMEGKSTAEAARILGTTAGAVKLRAHRGYVALRAMLRGHEARG
jgi:RNA polymerase sigma-70 factor (ECF subfamily)